MALVAYGASDSEEESDAEEEPSAGTVIMLKPPVPALDDQDTLFNILPTPKPLSFGTVTEEMDEFLMKKEVPVETPKKIKQPVKIGIPSLSQFDSDEDDEPREKKLRLVPNFRDKMEWPVERNDHFRHILLFEFNRGVTASEAAKLICTVYGENAICETTAQTWFTRFKWGHFDINDYPEFEKFMMKID